MYNTKFLFSILIVIVFGAVCRGQTTIIENGNSNASIYYEQNAPQSVKFAASELQYHLQLITGVKIPVVHTNPNQISGFVFYLGDNRFSKSKGMDLSAIKADGFKLSSVKNGILIAGNDYNGPPMTGYNNPWRINESYNDRLKISAFGQAGTLFGVYHILEKYLGIRWYMPGELGVVYEKRNTIQLPEIQLTKNPEFEHRHAYYGFMSVSDNDALWYRRAGFGSPAPIQISHSFGYFFLKYKDTHPEYFALIDGKYDFTNLSVAHDGNYNLRNKDFIAQVVKDINAYFDKNPNQKIVPLSPNDGMMRISEDPVSQATIEPDRKYGKFSNYVWGFINTVAKEVLKTHPDRIVGCLAYEEYLLPPSDIAKLSPNVAVMICKTRGNMTDLVYKKQVYDLVDQWTSKVKSIYCWDYYCDNLMNPGWKGYPVYYGTAVQNDLNFLKGKIKGEFIEAESWAYHEYSSAPDRIKIAYPGLQHLLLYVTAKLLWEPELNLNSLMDEYYRLFYGPAEVPMREFWQTVEQNWHVKGKVGKTPPQVYDQKTLNKLLACLDAALAKTTAHSVYAKRVDLIQKEFKPFIDIAERQKAFGEQVFTANFAKKPIEGGKNIQGMLRLIDHSYTVAEPYTYADFTWNKKTFDVDVITYGSVQDGGQQLSNDTITISLALGQNHPVQFKISSSESLSINTRGKGMRKVVVLNQPGRRVFRLSVPWSTLGIKQPKAGLFIMANVRRSRSEGEVNTLQEWVPQKAATSTFGKVILSDQFFQDKPEDKEVLRLASAADYGSGASIRSDWFVQAGNSPIGLFVGQPNGMVRNDRAVFRFDLRPFLKISEPTQRFELNFNVSGMAGAAKTRMLGVDYFNRPPEVINGDILADNDASFVENIEVSMGTSENKGKEPNSSYKVDITEAVKKKLQQGEAFMVFRIRDVTAEKEQNEKMQAAGVVLSKEAHLLPRIVLSTR